MGILGARRTGTDRLWQQQEAQKSPPGLLRTPRMLPALYPEPLQWETLQYLLVYVGRYHYSITHLRIPSQERPSCNGIEIPISGPAPPNVLSLFLSLFVLKSRTRKKNRGLRKQPPIMPAPPNIQYQRARTAKGETRQLGHQRTPTQQK